MPGAVLSATQVLGGVSLCSMLIEAYQAYPGSYSCPAEVTSAWSRITHCSRAPLLTGDFLRSPATCPAALNGHSLHLTAEEAETRRA